MRTHAHSEQVAEDLWKGAETRIVAESAPEDSLLGRIQKIFNA